MRQSEATIGGTVSLTLGTFQFDLKVARALVYVKSSWTKRKRNCLLSTSPQDQLFLSLHSNFSFITVVPSKAGQGVDVSPDGGGVGGGGESGGGGGGGGGGGEQGGQGGVAVVDHRGRGGG